MASTNKTAGLALSQFVAQDKPSWLSDYNNDMLAVDTAVKSLKERVPGAYTHGKVGSVHMLSGEGNDLRFIASADFNAGDGVQVNGEAVRLLDCDGKAVMDGFVAGDDVLLLRKGDEVRMVVPLRGKVDKGNLTSHALPAVPGLNYDGACAYYKDGFGKVTINFCLRTPGNASTLLGSDVVFANLPAGYRTDVTVSFPITAAALNPFAQNNMQTAAVFSNGQLRYYIYGTAACMICGCVTYLASE